MRLTSLGLRLRKYYGKEVLDMSGRKYHRVKGYPRKGGGRTKPHVRRMPKKCK